MRNLTFINESIHFAAVESANTFFNVEQFEKLLLAIGVSTYVENIKKKN